MEPPSDTLSLALIVWILLAILGRPLHDLLASLKELLCSPLQSIIQGLGSAHGALKTSGLLVARYIDHFWEAIGIVLGKVTATLDQAIATVRAHLSNVIDIIGINSQSRGWRVLGAFIYMAALALFLYADMAQGANNLSALYPDLQVPGYLQSLTIPLVISSAGTALALGLILGDLLGQTDLAPWSLLRGRTRKALLVIVVSTFLLSVVLALFLSLIRVKELLPLELAAETQLQMQVLAAFAQSVVILPLLVTTLLLLWGIAGFLALWLIFAGAVLLVLSGIRHMVAFLGTISPYIGHAGAAIISLISTMVGMALSVLRWLFTATEDIVVKLVQFTQALLTTVTYPLTALGSWIIRFSWPRRTLKLGPEERIAIPRLDVG